MPTITFNGSVPSSPLNALGHFEQIGAYGITTVTNTSILLTGPTGILSYLLIGTGITGAPEVGVVTGTITSMKFLVNGSSYVTISGLNLTATDFMDTAIADSSGLDPVALETLLLPLGYTYRGKDNVDYMPVGAKSADGFTLNFSGDDEFNTAGGNDNVWLGHGDDTARGGTGNDTFFGDLGNDRLFGGTGRDSLVGGAGKDRITGGLNADTMTGDIGPDTFLFALGDGDDVITDFAVNADTLDLPTGADFATATSGGNTILYYGIEGDEILLIGIDALEAASLRIV